MGGLPVRLDNLNRLTAFLSAKDATAWPDNRDVADFAVIVPVPGAPVVGKDSTPTTATRPLMTSCSALSMADLHTRNVCACVTRLDGNMADCTEAVSTYDIRMTCNDIEEPIQAGCRQLPAYADTDELKNVRDYPIRLGTEAILC